MDLRRTKTMRVEETRKIINGTVYDINKATLIGTGADLLGVDTDDQSEINYFVETNDSLVVEQLYKTEDGQFFVYGKGGNMSGYSERYVTGRGAGSDIWLIDEENVPDFLEKYELVDEFINFTDNANN